MAIGTPAVIARLADTSLSLTISTQASAVAAGETLFIASCGRFDDAENATYSASDDVNGAYTEDREQVSNSGGTNDKIRLSLDRFSNNAAISQGSPGDEVSSTSSGGGDKDAAALVAFSVDGLDLSPTTLANGDEAGFTSSPNSGNVTPSSGDWLLVGIVGIRTDTDAVSVESTGFTELDDIIADAGASAVSCRLHIATRIVTADGLTDYNYAPTLDAAEQCAVLIVAIPAAAGGATTQTRTGDLDAALQAQASLAGSLGAAVQAGKSASAALGAVLGDVGVSVGRGLSSLNETASLDRVIRPVAFFELEINDGSPSEFVRASDAPYSITWGGQEWLGVGTFGKISAAEETTELKAPGIEVTLNGVDPSLVSIALGRHIQGDPVTVYLGFLDEGHGLIDTPFILFRGRADTMPIKLGQTAAIRLTVESVLADWDRPRVRRYNNADQQQRFPSDKFFEFAEQTVDKDVIWPARSFFE